VTIVYRKTREEMPAGAEEVSEGSEEGLHFLFQRAPVRILGTKRVEGIVVQATGQGPPDARGRPTAVLVSGTEQTIPCDTVIVAAGEVADLTGMPSELDFKLSPQAWPEGRKPDWMTDVEGVFASGGRSVVYAMAAGTRTAAAIDAFIAKKTGGTSRPRPDPFGRAVLPKLPEGYGGPTWHF